jgi:hypothetical protein
MYTIEHKAVLNDYVPLSGTARCMKCPNLVHTRMWAVGRTSLDWYLWRSPLMLALRNAIRCLYVIGRAGFG